MKHFVIIGSEGFIGSRTAIYLSEQGHQVTAIDVPEAKGRSDFSNRLNNNSNIKVLYINDLSEFSWKKTSENPTIIYTANQSFHLANKSKLSENYFPDLHNLSKLIESIPNTCKPDISYLSSCAVYGTLRGKITEKSEVYPLNPYSLMKLTAEAMLKYYSQILQLNIRVFRLFTCYGSNQNRENFIGKLIQSSIDGTELTLFNQGSQIRDYLYIDDLVRALTLENFPEGFNIYNLGGKESIKLRDFANMINANYKLIGEDDENDIIICDGKLLRQSTGWNPKVNLQEGINKTIKDIELTKS